MVLITLQTYFKDFCKEEIYAFQLTLRQLLRLSKLTIYPSFSSFVPKLGFNSEHLNKVEFLQKLHRNSVDNREARNFISMDDIFLLSISHSELFCILRKHDNSGRDTAQNPPSFVPTSAQQIALLVFPKINSI